MRTLLITLRVLSRAAMLTALVVTLGIIGLRIAGFRVSSVQSASMQPTFSKGDAIILQQRQLKMFRPGQVVAYRNTRSPAVFVAHRVVSTRDNQLVTRGDANGSVDPVVNAQQIIGLVVAVAPKFGLVIDSLHQPTILVFVFYAPLIVLLSLEFRNFHSAIRHVHFKLTPSR